MIPNQPMQSMVPAQAGVGDRPVAGPMPAPQPGNIAQRLAPQLNTGPAQAGIGDAMRGVRQF